MLARSARFKKVTSKLKLPGLRELDTETCFAGQTKGFYGFSRLLAPTNTTARSASAPCLQRLPDEKVGIGILLSLKSTEVARNITTRDRWALAGSTSSRA